MPLTPEPTPPTSELRAKAFSVKPSDLGLKEAETGKVWGFIMETGYPETLFSLVVFGEGTTSIYFGNGGGIIGAGEHASVRSAGTELLKVANQNLAQLKPVQAPKLPHVGEVTFYFRTHSGLFAATAQEELLGEGKHHLSPLFYLAHNVITAVRENTPERKMRSNNAFQPTPSRCALGRG